MDYSVSLKRLNYDAVYKDKGSVQGLITIVGKRLAEKRDGVLYRIML